MRDEGGQLGGIEGLAFGVLIFVIGTLIIANAWGAIDAKLAAASAAREATRAYVESAVAGRADDEARQAAARVIEGYGRDPSRMTVRRDSGTFGRCERVTLTVEYRATLGAVPLLGRTARTFVAAARHSELVDPYRSGVPGEAHCVD
jgi:Flp pilus assembly protein TadG